MIAMDSYDLGTSMIEYLMYRKERCSVQDLSSRQPWDVFVSAYNDSDRVRQLFDATPAIRKRWLMASEYGYEESDAPVGAEIAWLSEVDEAAAIVDGFESLNVDWQTVKLCVDITGFMRPHILFLTKYLARRGVAKFDVVYSEPVKYKSKEKTRFALDDPFEVRQVSGFEGTHVTNVSGDLLVIGAGYDDPLVSRVAGNKEAARIVFLYGLPSLSADMYQESIMRMSQPLDAVEGRLFRGDGIAFASANDPFVTAGVLSGLCGDARSKHGVTNIYLSPLGTKPQTLGFALAYLKEFEGTPSSILFPFSKTYARETSTGIGRIWTYHIELSA